MRDRGNAWCGWREREKVEVTRRQMAHKVMGYQGTGSACNGVDSVGGTTLGLA
ncbi:hypothetical protein SESBI_42548 [Sesbania bispinosa]|nr:hypothetical protein SESBI_42548 [Sesbania bispinosa]